MTAAAETAAPAPGEREGQALWLNGLHLLALWGFALVQPLFDLLGRNADFFVARGSTSGDIVAFALAVTFIPPALLFGIEVLVGLVSLYARDWVHVAFIALISAIIALGFINKVFDAPSGVLIPVSLAIGTAAAVWYESEQAVRTFATVLSAAPPLFLFLFLFTSPVHKLVLTGEARAEAARVDSKTPVVMISFDEFPVTSLMRPDGSIDAARYPNFARLAREATWFRNATTVADGTRWATPIVISGQLPKKDALPTFQDYPQNLFTALGGGYRLHVTEPVTRLCPKKLCSDTGPREVEAGDVAGTASPDTEHEGFGERMGSMFSDLGIVSLHLVLPDDLRRRLPSVSEQLGNFGNQNKQAPAALPAQPRAAPAGGAAARDAAPPRHRPSSHRADPGGQAGRAVAARLPPVHRPDQALLRDREAAAVLHAHPAAPPPVALPALGADVQRVAAGDPGAARQRAGTATTWPSTRAGSATCSRSDTWTASSARWWRSSRPPGCGTAPWSCSRPTTA